MFRGTVKFEATMPGNRLQFSPFRFKPAIVNVDAIDIEASGDRITASVDVSCVSTPDAGMRIAQDAIEAALNRLCYSQQVVIGPAILTDRAFNSMNPPAGGPVIAAATGMDSVRTYPPTAIAVAGMDDAGLRSVLEPPSLPGEHNFALLRSARLSVGPVEEFMHLYGILLAVLNDVQRTVDKFIVSLDPAVPQTATLRPSARLGEMETVYTRLRNELAHKRPGVSVEATKLEMAQRVGDLRKIVEAAIDQHP